LHSGIDETALNPAFSAKFPLPFTRIIGILEQRPKQDFYIRGLKDINDKPGIDRCISETNMFLQSKSDRA
jgi:hypothetical protein